MSLREATPSWNEVGAQAIFGNQPYSFPKAALITYHKHSILNNTNALSYRVGGQSPT